MASLAERFWRYVDKEGPVPAHDPTLGPCWLWTAGRSGGYGIFSVGRGVSPRRAHQVSWDLHGLGEVPAGLVIRHRCDERLCVNPGHLVLGTRAENNVDTHTRGRWRWVAPGSGARKGEPQQRGPRPRPIEERFWPKVDKTGPPPPHDVTLGPCWLWTAKIGSQGYGAFFVAGRGRNAPFARAHRVSFEIANGPIPEGLDVLHRCDVRRCVNPAHLYLGTDRENMRDAVERGRRRSRRGEANPRAKLSDVQVREIRERYAAGGVSQVALGAEFDVSQAQISQIVRGKQRVS